MSKTYAIKVVPSLAAIPAATWDGLAMPDPATANPFVSHAFLSCLEDSGSVGARSGWAPRYLVLSSDDETIGATPAYLKSHSQGEYIFDHGWADAFERAGGRYYPKLQIAVPFTPVPGPRFLVGSGPGADERRQLLARGVVQVAAEMGVSSAHATFCTSDEWTALGASSSGLDLLQRSDQQFHWFNDDYATFDDFLAALSSRKRKT
ncbi:MAG TPA: peptidogalycan biosysnthesis protein, partial [Hyphomicrobiaceae bacterium]|nr:peptidogalycan biosysnthesis protein [Hyphomicrobiaceae bacterium]